MKKIILLLTIILCSYMVSADIVSTVIENEDLQLKDLYCNDAGQMGLKLLPLRDFGEAKITGILVRQAESSQFDAIKGSWDRETLVWNEQNIFRTAEFTSDEAQIYNQGNQELKIFYEIGSAKKEINVLFECQGTKFSCQLFDIKVESCESTNGIFTAVYNLKGFDSYKKYNLIPEYTLNDLTFIYVTENRFCDKKGNCGKSAGLPITSNIEFLSDEKVKVTWEYETKVKGASISLIPAESCEKKVLNYEMSSYDFKNCDADPYAQEFVCEGCEVGTLCILEGNKIIQDKKSLYCNEGSLIPQKPTGTSCKENIECLTNNCLAGVCSDELLPVCADGSLSSPCKCGGTDVRIFEGKSCCKGDVWEGSCPSADGTKIDEIKCGEGYALNGDVCVKIETNNGFFSTISNFFKKLFSRR